MKKIKNKNDNSMRTTVSNVSLAVFSILLITWLIISYARVIFNFTKIYTQDIPWLSIPYESQREIMYGDNEILYRKIQHLSTNKTTVYIVTQNYEPYFLLRYLLYPEQVYLITTVKDIHSKTASDLLLYYHEKAWKMSKKMQLVVNIKSGNYTSELFHL